MPFLFLVTTTMSTVNHFEPGSPHTATVSTSDGQLHAKVQLLHKELKVGESSPVMLGTTHLFTVTGVAAGILCEEKSVSLFAIAHSGKTIQFQIGPQSTWVIVHSS